MRLTLFHVLKFLCFHHYCGCHFYFLHLCTVERRVTAIEAIRDAENEHLLTRLRLLRSYLSKDQLNIPAVQFFKENLPNLSVIFNEDGEYELEWNAKCSDVPVNDDAERNMYASIPHRSSIAYPSDYVAAMPNISSFEFSSKAGANMIQLFFFLIFMMSLHVFINYI